MPLHLHRASRTDQLADALGDLLAVPPADPFAGEVVVVPAAGVERWLSQRLAHRLGTAPGRGDGVCAGVEFRSPWSLLAELTGTRDDDPWSPEALLWPLLQTLDEVLDEPWALPLARHLGARDAEPAEAELRRGRRLALAQRLARLFAGYAGQRPGVLAAWAAGQATDGVLDLPADLAWQPPLWRALADRVGGPTPVERHAAALAALRAGGAGLPLPARLSLFGHTRLALPDVELLSALGEHRDVHLWLPVPSAAAWERLARDAAVGPVPRADDTGHRLLTHPLLATLGRDVRELQRVLATVAPELAPVPPDPDVPDTLLGWLQRDLRADAVPTAQQREARRLRPDDRSVQVHACHGAARQIEVLREVLLGLLADDPTLEPRDIVVLCPDIETYAPLVAAGFGLADLEGAAGPAGAAGAAGPEAAHPAHRLRVRLADRALSRTNPLLGVLTALLDLAGGRATASEVVDLAHAEPVRRRFGFGDDDLQQLVDWVRVSGVRWAFDAEHRRPVGLGDYVANTWEFGLDRLLTGVAMSADTAAWLDRVLPLDDVGSGQVELVGRFVEFVERLRTLTDRLVGAHPLGHWLDVLTGALEVLTAVGADDAWQVGQAQRELGRLRETALAREGLGLTLRLPDVRALLADRLGGRPTRANFRTGTLTVCTMVPMRSVPHRVVCLVGLDDGAFPRVGIPDGDDVLARHPRTGERDARSEDRQLLLDALLAATETLVITYTGADEYAGQPRPPAVPLGEILDALDRTASAGSVVEGAPRSVAAAVTVHHPLQPFDARNHEPGALVPDGRPFSFDPATLRGARSARRPRVAVPGLLDEPLPPAPADDVLLDDLLAFWKNPAGGFVRQRLDLALRDDDEPLDDALPVEIDELTRWSVGDRVLRDLLDGIDPARVRDQEWRRGVLPPKWLGWRILGDVLTRAEPIAAEARRLRTRPPRAVDVDVDLGGGRRLRGTVPQVYGDRLVPASYSRLGATHRLQSWIRLLALAASDEDTAWTAHTLGRHPNSRSRDPVGVSLLGPLDYRALDHLRDLVALRDAGLQEPLPLPLKASMSYARKRRTHTAVAEALDAVTRYEWADGRFPGECSDPAHALLWPDRAFPGLGPARPGEQADGETTRFGSLALRVWSPLLIAEQGSW
ncbi:exodeoxyribonuclease V subunit gamma [Nocardioides fonticola]|uniref:exodeoxyribonuclease V subunit gamma n=1 Tax=Nocardioides fonticola TaxID=450363 RepID=UPI0031D56B26